MLLNGPNVIVWGLAAYAVAAANPTATHDASNPVPTSRSSPVRIPRPPAPTHTVYYQRAFCQCCGLLRPGGVTDVGFDEAKHRKHSAQVLNAAMPMTGELGGLLARLPANGLFENVNTPPSDATMR